MTNQAPLIDGYEVVIGIEIHCQLNTATKIFSPASTEFGQEPNTQANIIDLAMPGVLPVLNADVVEKAVKFGLGVNAQIGQMNAFDRKNYFYPDLPKGYQTSQMAHPIVGQGYIDILVNAGAKDEYTKRIGITRAHLEEDAGKSVHDAVPQMTGVDLNRAGTPLIEVVSEPDIRSADEAVAYVKTIHELVTWLGISDAIMAEGSFRADINVSVHKPNTPFGTRCELKNLNSFRFIERAIKSEIERQIDVLEDGGKIIQATRLYDPQKDETRAMRTKEEANDYRYFPCPDLLPVLISDETLQAIKKAMPELPSVRKERFANELGLSAYDANVLNGSRELSDYFLEVIEKVGKNNAKIAANWIMGDLLGSLNKNELSIINSPINAERLAGLIARILDNTISGKIAKEVFNYLWESDKSADGIIDEQGLKQETNTGAIEAIIKEVLANNQAMVDEYKGGKEKAFNGLVGQVMKASRGKANPAQVNELLKKLI
ncbi:Asp-tRNA(Asn)/Glu-tRNA(Gln) amidotransferase subunit GatB [Moraxella haemolytica]|uniref:Asp-tRNA(Asn)/Glu-tRNA(Gln) amidotransferase subunit GatB n=1 Tax=Moraxella haemolytica TaxID=2904119 RepID=UPI002542DD13|nr:Asp-tRNA(Asn)/Glu-tRNA(Gln) amidotransferase subunit GatB [Moraxella sp. ZY171148]WII95550.1 Asp-tRNA(Asn)/Glu-tRNA(Gln) amidotransferase subunit GatB [Moraxella sp. ZY171148]